MACRRIQYEVRSINDDTDRGALGRLYFESYEPGMACETLEEAIDDIDATFNGDYGVTVKPASLSDEGEGHVALRVDPDNSPAMRLYESIGFEKWRGD